MISEKDLQFSEKNYKRTRLGLDVLRRFLKVNIKVHNHIDQFQKGDIFLFNHFARFETFIPQYLIFEQTGKFSRSLAAAELFREDAFGRYLRTIGAVPNNMQDVIHFMACEMNRGYKVVIFPEGAMIKDRRVLGPRGRFRIYARDTKAYRKPHTGAAVIALHAQRMRDLLRLAHARNKHELRNALVSEFHAESLEEALDIASEPVRVVPANITFHPLRGDENFLSRVAERLGTVKSIRMEEELLIEGNILFKDTDMDIRLGKPILVQDYFGSIDWLVLRGRYFFQKEKSSSNRASQAVTWLANIRSEILSERIMVNYMKSIYSLVTVNLGHLCAELIYQLLQRYKQRKVTREFFHKTLYFMIKKLQETDGISYHRGLLNPDSYRTLLSGSNRSLEDFMVIASAAGLIEVTEDEYVFHEALEREYDFDEVRIKNFIRVRYNEIRPIREIEETTRQVLTHFDRLAQPESLGALLYDDDKRGYSWDDQIFCASRYDEVNRMEAHRESGEPFLLLPELQNGPRIGVLLIHGFTASPAEMRPLGEFLSSQGVVAYGVRLKGHGTSPCDLDFQTQNDWYRSVRRGWDVLRRFSDTRFLVGFSMGGGLALRMAAEKGNEIAGVVTISTPVRIQNRNILFANLVNQINRMVGALPYLKGVKRFKRMVPENPEINYQNVPISALYEFKKVMDGIENSLGEIYSPALIIQGQRDPTVDPVSAELILAGLASTDKRLVKVDSDRHVIIGEKGSSVQQEVLQFIREHSTPGPVDGQS